MAREVFQLLKSSNNDNEVKGFLVNTKTEEVSLGSLPIINYDSEINFSNSLLINGIGSPSRKKWIDALSEKGSIFTSAVHPSVFLGENVKVGQDAVISQNCVLTCDIKIGHHVILNANVTVGHDTDINDFSTISPGVNIGGRVHIGAGTFIGIGTTIIQDIKIGSNVFIGAGSVVVEDIPDDVLVFGSPAKVIRKIGENDWKQLL